MNTASEKPTSESNKNLTAGIVSRGLQILIMFIIIGAILFLAVGKIAWFWGWFFLGIQLVGVAINSVFMLHTNPETVAERGQPKDMKNWDKIIGGLWSVFQFMLLPAVSGLDVRFGWSGEPGLAWHVIGVLVFIAGSGLFSWAMIANTYFSTVVRIQTDRGQMVCKDGPYRFVRHPGYVGAILQSFGAPLLLGSWWALIVGVIAAAMMVIRTALEDRTLQDELPGYQEFTQEVRYRLLPGVW
ncbi:MAG TPA: isoprenylcysteine carboxylmethyltransferase family protein [Longilinea sp.]|nr:isoprenylcysteine carboxylmethyltransferase family protein [Longilinea sp.]